MQGTAVKQSLALIDTVPCVAVLPSSERSSTNPSADRRLVYTAEPESRMKMHGCRFLPKTGIQRYINEPRQSSVRSYWTKVHQILHDIAGLMRTFRWRYNNNNSL